MNPRWILALSLAVLLSAARAQAEKLIAIMPVDVSHARGKLDADAQTFLQDALRGAAANALAGAGFTILTAGRTETELAAHDVKAATCVTEWCQTKAARALGLAKFLRTSVHFDDGQLTADVQIIDTAAGSITASIDGEGATATALRKSLAAKAPALFRWAAPPAPPAVVAAEAPAPASGTGIPRAVWVNRLKEKLPAAICDTTYFVQCFTATRSECIAAATRSSSPCFEAETPRLPELIDPHDGRAWGSKIGGCAGVALDDALSAKKSANPKCSDVSLWQ